MDAVLEKPVYQVVDSVRQFNIATKDAEGKSQPIIAKEVGVSQSTVSNHLAKPEVKELSQRLRDLLQNKHAHHFIKRVVKEAKVASKLSDFALGRSKNNPTNYDQDGAEKFLTRADRTGLAILKGVGILDTNTIRFGDDNSVSVTVSPAFQQFIDFNNTHNNGEEQPETVDIEVSDGE